MLPEPLQQIDRTYVRWRGKKLIYFAGCDYFRMSSHPIVLRAMAEGLQKFGLNVAASRKTTGNHRIYEQLELELARFFGAESSVLTSSGYFSNLVALQGLTGSIDAILLDEQAHNSLLDAAALVGLPIQKFKAGDPSSLREFLRKLKGKRVLVGTDGVFAHSGRIARLGEYLKLLPGNGLLLVDDSHGAGVLGHKGRGTPEHFGIQDSRVVQTITLSKAFGVYGGAVVTHDSHACKIKETSRIFAGNTPMPFPLANAALKAIKLLKKTAPRQQLTNNVTRLKQRWLKESGWDGLIPIIGMVPSGRKERAETERLLLKNRVFPSFIRYGASSAEGYFRFALSSEHSAAQIDALGAALASAPGLQSLGEPL